MTGMNLLTDLCYRPFTDGAERLRDAVYKGEAGTDGLIHIAFLYSDDISLQELSCGFRLPYTEEEKRLIESGETLPEKEDETIHLPSGHYIFSQTIPFTDMESLKVTLLPWCGISNHCYVRLFNESLTHKVSQLFIPQQLPCR